MLRNLLLAALFLTACHQPPDPLIQRAEVATDRAEQGFLDDETRSVLLLLDERAAIGSTPDRIAALDHAATLHLAVAHTLFPHSRHADDESDYARSMRSEFEGPAWAHREQAIAALEQAKSLGDDDPSRTATLEALHQAHADWQTDRQRATDPVLDRMDRLRAAVAQCSPDSDLHDLFRQTDAMVQGHLEKGGWDWLDGMEPLVVALETSAAACP